MWKYQIPQIAKTILRGKNKARDITVHDLNYPVKIQ